jgi:hypothetical protein
MPQGKTRREVGGFFTVMSNFLEARLLDHPSYKGKER